MLPQMNLHFDVTFKCCFKIFLLSSKCFYVISILILFLFLLCVLLLCLNSLKYFYGLNFCVFDYSGWKWVAVEQIYFISLGLYGKSPSEMHWLIAVSSKIQEPIKKIRQILLVFSFAVSCRVWCNIRLILSYASYSLFPLPAKLKETKTLKGTEQCPECSLNIMYVDIAVLRPSGQVNC